MYSNDDLFDVWHPWWLWECYKLGMWNPEPPRKEIVKLAARVLRSDELYKFMCDAIDSMPNSAMHHMSKPWLNRAPWLGQSACLVAVGATEEETRLAWCQKLNFDQQVRANEQAKKAIKYWERSYA